MKKTLIFSGVILVIFLIIFFNCPTQESNSSGSKGSSSTTYSAVGLYDTIFNNGGIGTNDTVRAIAVQSDGKILIGGDFTTYNLFVFAPNYIMRLNTDGSYDSTFNNGGDGTDGPVYDIAIQSDNKILIGGNFVTYNGAINYLYIARIDPNSGTIDPTFNPIGSGPNDIVRCIAVQSGGKILIGGDFTHYNGVDVPDGIIRLNAENGSIDPTFDNAGSGANNDVRAITVQSDRKILIGGDFTRYNDVDVPDGIIRLNTDGSYDPTFDNAGSGANNDVRAITVQSDRKILIGGDFTHYNGVDVPDGIIRLNTNGSHDTAFNYGGEGADDHVYTLAAQSDGRILIGGVFSTYNGIDVPNPIRLNVNGSYDSSFNNGGTGATGTGGIVYDIEVQPDGKILIGGNFTHYNGVDVPDGIIRLY